MTDISFHEQVRIVPYREEWMQRFRIAKELIIALLLTANIECDVRHVGGTAIPGMCSKPIVDVLVMVAPGDLEQAARALAEHIPCLGECGRPGRYFFSHGDTERDAVYIHLTAADNQVAKDQLKFLDMLRTCPDLRHEYAELKTRLAAQYPENRAIYRLKKGVFIEKCLADGYDMQGDCANAEESERTYRGAGKAHSIKGAAE